MRYYKVIEITGHRAASLIANNRGADRRAAVVSFDGTWYDVRSLSAKEFESFIDDLARRKDARACAYRN